jgi:hypothetical protein
MTASYEGIRKGNLKFYLDGLLGEFGQVVLNTQNSVYSLNQVGGQIVLSEITGKSLKPKYRGSEWWIISDLSGRLRFQMIDNTSGPVKTSPIKAFVIPVGS